MMTEFNWYIVIDNVNILGTIEDEEDHRIEEIKLCKRYILQKNGYRIYPMDTPLPVIYRGACLYLGIIKQNVQENGKSVLTVEPILVFNKEDPVRKYYEQSFDNYRIEQQVINDGGLIDVREVVNARTRKRIRNRNGGAAFDHSF